MDLSKALTKVFSTVHPRRDGDVVDRINYGFTTTILLGSAFFVFSLFFIGVPVKCWFPAYFKGWWIQYALDYCFVQNTYYIPMHDEPLISFIEDAESLIHLPTNITTRREKELTYYQWVPFMLALQAILFYAPVVIWRAFNNSAGLFVNTILLSASESENVGAEKRKKNMEKIAKYMNTTRLIQHELRSKRTLTGRYVVVLYMIVKLLYVLNIVAQFFIMNLFLGYGSYSFWGFGIMDDLLHGRSWKESGHFPRVTLCDLEVKELENVHRHTVQCILHINMFNEKIYIFLWFWFFFVAVITVLNCLHWFYLLVVPGQARSFVASYLRKIDKLDDNRRLQGKIDRFVKHYLLSDGVFLLRMISCNAGDIVCADLMRALWEDFKQLNHVESVESSPSKSEADTIPFLPPPKYDESEAQNRNGRESEM